MLLRRLLKRDLAQEICFEYAVYMVLRVLPESPPVVLHPRSIAEGPL